VEVELPIWAECVGTLERVEREGGAVLLTLRLRVRLPEGTDLLRFRRAVGRRVGILRTDEGVLLRVLETPSPHQCPVGRGTGRGVETPGAKNWGSPDRGMPVKKNEEELCLRS
jgi:hypothetical protein